MISDVLKPRSKKEILKEFKKLDPNQVLTYSVEQGSLFGIKWALKHDAKILVVDDALLCLTIARGDLGTIIFLLNNGLYISRNTWSLVIASYYGKLEIVKLLLSKGIRSYLHVALREARDNGNVEIVKVFESYIK